MQAWLNKLKIALAEEDIETIGQLFTHKIQNATPDELQQALFLTKEALKLMEKEKKQLAGVINKIKTAKEFFKA